MSHPYVIGLTGGIGSGKSTVADLFKALGVTVIDTDQIARDVVLPHTQAYQKIVAHFDKSILKHDAHIDRKKLRNIIFNHPHEKAWLEQLLHPLIREQITIQINSTQTPYCILVVPLLIEKHPYPHVQRILTIDIDQATQLDRASQRDNAAANDILAIINSQASREERNRLSNDIIYNDGSLAQLAEQVSKLHDKYLKIAKNKAN